MSADCGEIYRFVWRRVDGTRWYVVRVTGSSPEDAADGMKRHLSAKGVAVEGAVVDHPFWRLGPGGELVEMFSLTVVRHGLQIVFREEIVPVRVPEGLAGEAS